ncbi:MAG: guanylate kinase [Endomicrobium sp.]|nr:guanylate kinase [Endomicrobium sp.]
MNKVDSPIQSLGNVVVISAPSGAGKTSICDAIARSDGAVYSVSYTTRSPRQGEKNGKEYFFVDESNFKKMIKSDKFAEWAKVHGNYYGTPRELLDKTLKSGKNIFLEIDVRGGMNIKKQYPQACMIFIMAPDLKTLEKRLVVRNKDRKETINIRLNNAKKELTYLHKYEYLVVNRKLKDSVVAIKTIVKSLEYKIKKDQRYFD